MLTHWSYVFLALTNPLIWRLETDEVYRCLIFTGVVWTRMRLLMIVSANGPGGYYWDCYPDTLAIFNSLLWRLDTYSFHVHVADPQLGYRLEYMTGYQDVTLPHGTGTEPCVHDRVPRCYPTPGYRDRTLSTWQGTKMLPYPRVRGQILEYMTGYQDVTLPQGTGTEPCVHDRVPRCYPTPGYRDRTLSTWQGTKMLPYPRV